MVARSTRTDAWTTLGDEHLLDLSFSELASELRLRIEGTQIERRIAGLVDALELRGLRFRPHCWLAEEWFAPDHIPGIAIPFYLAHPRLAKLELRQMHEVEGGTERSCQQLLRHEAGHAVECAFRLNRRARWREIFGDHREPYPDHYQPRPESRDFVLHLDRWYAQSHPCEDFAETFAVWLSPRARWRRQYAGWPALQKLEYMDRLMASIAGRDPLVPGGGELEPIGSIHRTLREHYEEKRARYRVEVSGVFDYELRRLFTGDEASPYDRRQNGRLSAATFLGRIGPQLCLRCARGTGRTPYTISQVLNRMRLRCRELDLRIARPLQDVQLDVAIFLSAESVEAARNRHHRIPV